MGGGGGGYFGKHDAKRAIDELHKADEKTRNVQLDTDISELIADILGDYNNRREEIPGHIESIKSALEKDIEGTIDLMFGGSIARHTYIDGLSDVDSLVILDNCELANKNPQEARHYIAERLRERFPQSNVKEGDLAVTIGFKTVEIQLVPAVRCESTVTISNSRGDKWMNIDPRGFAEALTKANISTNRKLVPMIKLAKGINAGLPDNQRLKSYHLESLAIEVFKKYAGPTNTKKMLRHFFSEAPGHVMNLIKDKTGQTIHVDDYLGKPDSAERRLVANALGRIGRRMKNADLSNSLEQWKEILN